jgi:Dolichyl-phosphate-mannose-protein mannosyltransferase
MEFLRTFLPAKLAIGPPDRDGWLYQTDKGALWDYMSLCLVLLGAALVFLTFRDYGVTWDEPLHNRYGNFVLDYYTLFFVDKHSLDWNDIYAYGAAFDMAAAAVNRISSMGTYETRHLLNGLVGVLGVVGCCKLGRAIGGARAGFLAALLLLLTPNYYGQMFNNPKDIPFAVGLVWGTYYLARLVPVLPRPPLRLLAKLGATIGLAMGVRVGGFLLVCYLGLLLAVSALWRAAAARRAWLLVELGWASLWRVLLPVVLVAYPIMLMCWPWAQTDPLFNPLGALVHFSHFYYSLSTLFAGQLVPASDLPWAYLPTYIALAVPELVLVLLICAPVVAVIGLWRSRFCIRREDALMSFLVGWGIVFPIAYAIAIKSTLYDGMRHLIFVLPLIAIAAALVADQALIRLERFPYRPMIYTALALYSLVHLSIMAMLHPNEYVYYNAFVGGVEGAQRKFNLDYWANSYAEAVQGLEDHLRAQYGLDFEEREFTVAVCGPPYSAQYYFPGNFRFIEEDDQADFFIAFTKDDCDRSLPGRPVYQVERMGALLSVVLDRRHTSRDWRRAFRQSTR